MADSDQTRHADEESHALLEESALSSKAPNQSQGRESYRKLHLLILYATNVISLGLLLLCNFHSSNSKMHLYERNSEYGA